MAENLDLRSIANIESKKLTDALQRMRQPLAEIGRKNILCNNVKKSVYLHLLSLKNNKYTLSDVNFAIAFQNIKENVPRQIRLFTKLKETIADSSNQIKIVHSVHNKANYTIVPLMELSETIQKNNFSLMQQIDSLIKVLEEENRSLSFIDDSRALVAAYKIYYSNTPSVQRRLSDSKEKLAPQRGLFGNIRFKRQIGEEEQILHAADFIKAFDQERNIYIQMEKSFKQIIEAVGVYERTMQKSVEAYKKNVDVSYNHEEFMDGVRKLLPVAIGIPAYLALFGEVIGYGNSIGVGVFTFFAAGVYSLLSESSAQQKTYKGDYPDSNKLRQINSMSIILDEQIARALKNAGNVISVGQDIRPAKISEAA